MQIILNNSLKYMYVNQKNLVKYVLLETLKRKIQKANSHGKHRHKHKLWRVLNILFSRTDPGAAVVQEAPAHQTAQKVCRGGRCTIPV